MSEQSPVEDWATDYEIFDPHYAADPLPVWDDLRGRCPIAHSDRHEGSFLPTKYADVQAIAKMPGQFSSSDPLVVPLPEAMRQDAQFAKYGANAPPISSDGAEHTWTRRLLLPHFSPPAVEKHRAYTEDVCHRLIDGFIDHGQVDGATNYAQQIPPRVIAHLLGVDESRVDDFTYWVRAVLELGLTQPELRVKYRAVIRDFFRATVAERRANPGGTDLISALLDSTDPDGNPVDTEIVVGMANLQLVAGIDTTWSSIGSALFHLGTHPADLDRLRTDPDVWPLAIEEFLRYYSPVTMARKVTEPVSYGGVDFSPGDKVLMNFPGANHDPDVFENPGEFVIDRAQNRHVAFGAGIHRCAGSNLARLEMDVALRAFVERIGHFSVETPSEVAWAGGQVRGPRILPITF